MVDPLHPSDRVLQHILLKQLKPTFPHMMNPNCLHLNGPIHGIALRGPLSQFFSAIYLKPLDDAFDNMNVTYLRYQDDILILCQTKRQLNRCKRRMMEILNERRLGLSRKKSLMGLD